MTLGIALTTFITRLPALLHPGPIDDEAVYAVVATEMVRGGRPYVDAIERKPPLLFWLYEAVFKLFGPWNWTALHIVGAIWVLLTALGLYVLARRFFQPQAAAVAALLYVAFQHWATSKNLAVNGELLMNLPIVWSGVLVWGPARKGPLLLAGVLMGTAFLMKQPAGVALVAYGLYLLLPSYRRARGLTLRQTLVHAIVFGAGFVLCLAATGAVLAYQGILRDAAYWTIGDHDVPFVFWTRAFLFTAAFCGACLPLVALAMPSILRPGWWPAESAARTGCLWLLALSAVGVSASGRFYPHYFIQLLPPLALFAAATYEALPSHVSSQRLRAIRATLAAAMALALAGFFVAQWIGLRPLRQPSMIGSYLRDHSTAGDRLFVWGQSPGIYDDSGLRPASRYITTFPLTGYIFAGPVPGVDTRGRILAGSWDNLVADFARHPPSFIVDAEVGPKALYPMPSFPRLDAIVRSEFTPILATSEGVLYARRR